MSRHRTRLYIENLISDTLRKNNSSLKDARVLELGCGTGTFFHFACKNGCKSYTGLDVSSKMIDIAKKRSLSFKNVDFINESLENFHPMDTYDIIISSSFLHHLSDLEFGLKCIQSLLGKNGLFIGLHERSNLTKICTLERFDNELQGLFGYSGNSRFNIMFRLLRFVKNLPSIFCQEKSNQICVEDFVDYQLNHEFDLSKNIAAQYGKTYSYKYLGFIELLKFFKLKDNQCMFVMKKKNVLL